MSQSSEESLNLKTTTKLTNLTTPLGGIFSSSAMSACASQQKLPANKDARLIDF